MLTGRLVCLLISLWLIAAPVQAEAAPVIIKLAPGVSLAPITSLLRGVLIDSIPGSNIHLLNLPSIPVLSLPLRLLGLEWVEANVGAVLPGVQAVADLTVPASVAPDWYHSQPALQLVRSNEARAYSTGRGVVVADINSQYDYSHPALRGHLTSGRDFVESRPAGTTALNQSSSGFLDGDEQSSSGFLDRDEQSSSGFLDDFGIRLLQSSSGFLDGSKPAYSHGTLTAGLIAATAPDAMIMPLRAFDENGSSDVFTLAKAVRYAVANGAHVINMSFGTRTNSKALKEAIDFAIARNVVLVASAGNDNTSTPQYPAAYSGVLAIAATDVFDRKASFSNYGSVVFVDAPGSQVISAYPGNRYNVVSGTSFAAPIAAGAAALIRAEHSSSAVAYALARTAVNINSKNPRYYGQLGYGRIDIARAVR